jgi:hypothetical protein
MSQTLDLRPECFEVIGEYAPVLNRKPLGVIGKDSTASASGASGAADGR